MLTRVSFGALKLSEFKAAVEKNEGKPVEMFYVLNPVSEGGFIKARFTANNSEQLCGCPGRDETYFKFKINERVSLAPLVEAEKIPGDGEESDYNFPDLYFQA